MGFFSRKKKTVTDQAIEFTGIHGQATTIKSLLLAGLRGVPMDVKFLEGDINVDQLNSYQKNSDNGNLPSIKQGDFSVNGARGIQTYLDIRGKGASLYPKKARNLGQQNYWIEVGFKVIAPVVQSIVNGETDEDTMKTCDQVLSNLNTHLESESFIAGPLSLADPSVAAYVYLLRGGGTDMQNYPNVSNWISRLEGQMTDNLKTKYLSLIHSDSEQLVA